MPPATEMDTRFRVTEAQARELVRQFGTPLYVLNETLLRKRAREYREALEASYPKTKTAYASKANTTLAVLAILHKEGCLIDVASEGELRAALSAGVPAKHCHLHGNNKSASELEFAIAAGVGGIVVDHFGEIEMLSQVVERLNGSTDGPRRGAENGLHILLRLAPGVDPITHRSISTGQEDTKFGFNIANGSAERALLRCLELRLPVVGFHSHVGSQLLDPGAQRAAGELLARFTVKMLQEHGFRTEVLNVGGGLGARYTDADRPMPVGEYCRLIAAAVKPILTEAGLEPCLMHEPGRALVAEAGVTLYRVGVVKDVPAGDRLRRYVCVDGGLADNPRPALYGARYQVERIGAASGLHVTEVTVSGRHCESDELFPRVQLPSDIAPGDILQVLTTGAYSSSMASNYNRYPRPATVLIRGDGSFSLVQRGETWDEMLARELVPEDLLA